MKLLAGIIVTVVLVVAITVYLKDWRNDRHALVNVVVDKVLEAKNNHTVGPLPANAVADKVLIEKGKRRLTLLYRNRPLKTYTVSLGRAPVGRKTEEGDGRTPEGVYTIDWKKADSAYHRALHISYPNADDRARAKARGVSPGSDIMIHGLPNGHGHIGKLHTMKDWTRGCVAVTNQEIEEIWRVVPDRTVVEIVK